MIRDFSRVSHKQVREIIVKIDCVVFEFLHLLTIELASLYREVESNVYTIFLFILLFLTTEFAQGLLINTL